MKSINISPPRRLALFLSVISIPPTIENSATGVVVGLHGWGASAEDLASLAPFLDLPNHHFYFPDAPFNHPYSSQGKMWYSFSQNPVKAERSQAELDSSRDLLQSWLVSLPDTTKIPLEHTFILGFSQGGAMALDLGFKLPVAGLVILSGYLHPAARDLNAQLPPILMVHGKQDTVVTISSARSASTTLKAMGARLDYQEFDMGHEVSPQILPIITNFITYKSLSQ